MLSILPTINPIIDLFTKQTLLSNLDGSDLFLFYLELAGLVLAILLTAYVYLKNKHKDKKVVEEKIKPNIFAILTLACCSFFTYFSMISPRINLYNKINDLSLEQVFSSYYIKKIEKTEIQSKVYLKKIKNNRNTDESIYEYLDDSVVINVSKVNKDSFDIILSDDKVETIKKDDAPEVFNALKKIKEDKAWEEINRLMRSRQVKEGE